MLHALLVIAVAPQLAMIAWNDFNGWRISNRANLAFAATYFIFAALLSAPWTIAVHAAFAALMFAIMLFPFTRGWLGGGDVKFLTASFLWTGPDCALVYSLALLPPMLAYLVLARSGVARAKREEGQHRVPFGPIGAVALAFTLVVCEPF
ncbi:MAG: prepilin peptidase [Beijerinckiaceae bacterium]